MKKDIVFVISQFVLFVLFIIDFNLFDFRFDLPSWMDIPLIAIGFIGAVIILMGIINLNDNLTPFPTPRKNANLISHGIYHYIRHPIYTGIVVVMFAYGLYSNSLDRLVLTGILFLLFYFKSEYEEKLLIERFLHYKDYRKLTGRFFPRVNRK